MGRRPIFGKRMTNAEKQQRYRDRLYGPKCAALEAEVRELRRQIAKTKARAARRRKGAGGLASEADRG